MARRKANTKFDHDEFVLELSERLLENSRAPDIKKYKPHQRQYEFHSSNKKKKLYIGGNRSGKTTGGVTEGIWRATCRHPYRPELNERPSKGRVIAVDFINGIEKIVFPQYKQWLYPSALRGGSWESAYDRFTKTLNFSNGSTIEFMSYDQDLDKFAGTSRDWIHFDEEPPQSIYIENMARLIDTNGEFWITMTPVEGMTWVYEELYDGNLNNEDGNVQVIEIDTRENPYLGKDAVESFSDSIDESERQARISGTFVQQGGRIYKNFDPTVGGPHVLKAPIDEPRFFFKDWLWIAALDHGLNNPTAVLWIAIDKNGFAVVFDEHYMKDWTVDQHAKAIAVKVKHHGRLPDIWVADPSIKQRSGGSGTSVQSEYQRYGISFTLGNNDVKSGLIRVKRYFNKVRYVGRRTHPLFVDDNDQNLDAFPMLRIAPNCGNLINELKYYRWKTYSNKKLSYDNNPYDEPHKKNDHAVDALRYGLMTQPDLFADKELLAGGDSFKNKVDKALETLGLNGDEPQGSFGWSDQVEIADPWDRLGEPMESPVAGGWSYDEHLGLNY